MTRVVLVTGASSGIGWAIARRLVDDGDAVGFVTSGTSTRSSERFAALSARGQAELLTADLANVESVATLVPDAIRRFGRIDALVNCAGITVARPALTSTAADFDAIFGIDVRAAFLLSRDAAEAMAGHGGAIVNVTSVHAHVPRHGFALYAAAKAALAMLTRGLALELAELGVRVNEVAPGIIATARNEEAEVIGSRVPMGRAGFPDEVAGAVAFLLSPEASYITGASLSIDGGVGQTTVIANAGPIAQPGHLDSPPGGA